MSLTMNITQDHWFRTRQRVSIRDTSRALGWRNTIRVRYHLAGPAGTVAIIPEQLATQGCMGI